MKIKFTVIFLVMAASTLSLWAANLPAPLPEFMGKEQLAKLKSERAGAARITSAPKSSIQFYTGKPYVADAGGYIFKFRTYNPEMSRWTSADPGGFPDGANNRIYAPTRMALR